MKVVLVDFSRVSFAGVYNVALPCGREVPGKEASATCLGDSCTHILNTGKPRMRERQALT
eukprot:5802244-Amphidinium_carterae.1